MPISSIYIVLLTWINNFVLNFYREKKQLNPLRSQLRNFVRLLVLYGPPMPSTTWSRFPLGYVMIYGYVAHVDWGLFVHDGHSNFTLLTFKSTPHILWNKLDVYIIECDIFGHKDGINYIPLNFLSNQCFICGG